MTEGVYYQDKNIFRFRDINIKVIRTDESYGYSYSFDSTSEEFVLFIGISVDLKNKIQLAQINAEFADDYEDMCSIYSTYLQILSNDQLVELYKKLSYPSAFVVKYLESVLPASTLEELAKLPNKTIDGKSYFSQQYQPKLDVNNGTKSNTSKFAELAKEDEDIKDGLNVDPLDLDLSFIDEDIKNYSAKHNKQSSQNSSKTSDKSSKASDKTSKTSDEAYKTSDSANSKNTSSSEQQILSYTEIASFQDLDVYCEGDLNEIYCDTLEKLRSQLITNYKNHKKEIKALDQYGLKVLVTLLGFNRAPNQHFFEIALEIAQRVPSVLVGQDSHANYTDIFANCRNEIEDISRSAQKRFLIDAMRDNSSEADSIDTFFIACLSFKNRYTSVEQYNDSSFVFVSPNFDRYLIKGVQIYEDIPRPFSAAEESPSIEDFDYISKFHFNKISSDGYCFNSAFTDQTFNNFKTLKYKLGQELTWSSLADVILRTFLVNSNPYENMSEQSLQNQVKEAYKIAQKFNLESMFYFEYENGFNTITSHYLFDFSSCSIGVQKVFATIFNLLFNHDFEFNLSQVQHKNTVTWSEHEEISKFYQTIEDYAIKCAKDSHKDRDSSSDFINQLVVLLNKSEANVIALLRCWYARTSMFNITNQQYIHLDIGYINVFPVVCSVSDSLLTVWTELLHYISLSQILATIVSCNKQNQANYPNLERAVKCGELCLDILQTMLDSMFSGTLVQKECASWIGFDHIFKGITQHNYNFMSLLNQVVMNIRQAVDNNICSEDDKVKYWDQGLNPVLIQAQIRLQEFALIKLQNYLGFVAFEDFYPLSEFLTIKDGYDINHKPKIRFDDDAIKSALFIPFRIVDYVPYDVSIKHMLELKIFAEKFNTQVCVAEDMSAIYLGGTCLRVVINNTAIDPICAYNHTTKERLVLLTEHMFDRIQLACRKLISPCKNNLDGDDSNKIEYFDLSNIDTKKSKDASFDVKFLVSLRTLVAHCNVLISSLANSDIQTKFKFNQDMSELVYNGVKFKISFTQQYDTAFVYKSTDNLPLHCVLPINIPSAEFLHSVDKMLDNAIKRLNSTTFPKSILPFRYLQDCSLDWHPRWSVPNFDDDLLDTGDIALNCQYRDGISSLCYKLPCFRNDSILFISNEAMDDLDDSILVVGYRECFNDEKIIKAIFFHYYANYHVIWLNIFLGRQDKIRKAAQRFDYHVKTFKANVQKFIDTATPEQANRVKFLSDSVETINHDYANIKRWSSGLLSDIKDIGKYHNVVAYKHGFRNIVVIRYEYRRFFKSVDLAFSRLDEYKKLVKSWLPQTSKPAKTTKKKDTKKA